MNKHIRKLVRRFTRASPYPEQFMEHLDLPEFDGDPFLYMIASTPRCGSHLLGHALIETKYFGVPLEYFHPNNANIWKKKLKANNNETLLGELIKRRTSSTGFFGFKAHWTHLESLTDKNVFNKYGGIQSVIWIYRRNILKQAISLCIARQTKQWISGSKKHADPVYDYNLIVSQAIQVRDQNRQWQRYLASKFSHNTMVVSYEDILAQSENVLKGIALHIDPFNQIQPKYSEKTTQQSDSVSDNWHDCFINDVKIADQWILSEQNYNAAISV